jgi:hypothetical protein
MSKQDEMCCTISNTNLGCFEEVFSAKKTSLTPRKSLKCINYQCTGILEHENSLLEIIQCKSWRDKISFKETFYTGVITKAALSSRSVNRQCASKLTKHSGKVSPVKKWSREIKGTIKKILL